MTEKTADLRDEIAEALMSWAERNANPQYASLRRPETVRQNAYSRADAVLAVLAAPAVGQPAEAQATDEALARVRSWIASQPVTARSEFGNGYREALRDITDVINGRQTVEDER